MKTIRFTKAVDLTVHIEAQVPDDWSEEDIQDFARDTSWEYTVEASDHDIEVDIESIYLETATIVSVVVHNESN